MSPAAILSVVVRANTAQANAALTRTHGLMKGMAVQSGFFGERVARGMKIATLAAVGFAAASGVMAIDFDKSMRNVNSLAKLPEPAFQKLEKSVLSLAGPTAQAPTVLADAMYQLVSSGFDAHESLHIVEKSAIAASAGLTDAETATKAVAGVLNAYRLPASRAGAVSDDLFQTVNLGVLSFEELSQTIGDVLPFSSTLGVNLKAVGAATSTMTRAGLPAPETMTRIKNVMVALIKPSEALEAAYKKLGVAGGEDLIKKFGGGRTGFQKGLEALVATTDGTKASIGKLFPNIRAMGGAFALTGGNIQRANEDLDAFKNTSGATTDVFAEQQKSAALQIQQAWAETQANLIRMGAVFAPIMADMAHSLSDFVEMFEKLPGPVKTSVVVLGLMAYPLFKMTALGLTAAASLRTLTASTVAAGTASEVAAGQMTLFGTAAPAGIAANLVKFLPFAIAAAGVGMVVYKAVQGDIRGVATSGGGLVAGAIVGGIVGGLPGALIGAGIGGIGGGLLDSLLGDAQEFSRHERMMRKVSDVTEDSMKKMQEAVKDYKQDSEKLDGMRKREKHTTEGVQKAEKHLAEVRKEFPAHSKPVIQAEMGVVEAKRKDINATKKLREMEKLHGIEKKIAMANMRGSMMAVLREIAARKHETHDLRIDLKQTWREFKKGDKSIDDVNDSMNKFREARKKLQEARGKRMSILGDAEKQISPAFMKRLKGLSAPLARAVGDAQRFNKKLREFKENDGALAKVKRGLSDVAKVVINMRRQSEGKPLINFDALETEKNVGRIKRSFEDGRKKIKHSMEGARNSVATNITSINAIVGSAVSAFGDGSVAVGKQGPKKQGGGGVGFQGIVPGTGTGDKMVVTARVESGEGLFVMNRNAMGALQAHNDAFPRFQKGGALTKIPLRVGKSPGTIDDKSAGEINEVVRAANKYIKMHSPVSRMQSAAQHNIGGPYTWGGGHGGFTGMNVDCSGLVSYLLHVGNFLNGAPMTTDGLKGWGSGGPGRQVTVGVRGSTGRNAHTMIQMGNMFAESGSGHGAQIVSGWSGNFPIKRHPEGYQKGGEVAKRAMLFDPKSPYFVGWGMQKGGALSSAKIKRKGAVFGSTAYGPPWGGINGTGVTATGINLSDGPMRHLVAVDPGRIPLHSKLGIWPNPFDYHGAFAAEDTGGAIQGNRIDFYDWKGRGHQMAWGERNVKVAQAAAVRRPKRRPKPKGKDKVNKATKGLDKLGFPNSLTSQILQLTNDADIYAEYADRASQMEGLVLGYDDVYWLQKELGALRDLRNKVLEAMDTIVTIRAAVQKRISALTKQWNQAKKAVRLAKPKQKDSLGKAADQIKNQLDKQKTIFTDLGGRSSDYQSSLQDIQGLGTGGVGGQKFKVLPDVGVLGGRIFDVQMALKEAGGSTDVGGGSTGTSLTAEDFKNIMLLKDLGVVFNPAQFGGFFAKGGMLGAGKWGIAGENGPEPIVGPAFAVANGGGGAGRVEIDVEVTDKQIIVKRDGKTIKEIAREAIDERDAEVKSTYKRGRIG